jgi:hypothetical protein
LPAVETVTSIEDTLRKRESVRFYDPSPIGLKQLTAVLMAAEEADAELWAEERLAGLSVELLVAAWRVEDLEQAIHAYRPPDVLERVGSLPPPAAASELVLQLEYSFSPALVLVVGNLCAAIERHGAHGHRVLLERGGAVAHAGWLGALSVGLAGSVFAGFLPAALRSLAGLDGYSRLQLFALSIGLPS